MFYGEGASGQKGIYALLAGALTGVADTATAIPGGSGNLTAFNKVGSPPAPIRSDTSVVFYGEGAAGQQGIYTRIAGALAKVADTSTLIPLGSGNFTALSANPVLVGDVAAFTGSGSGGQQGVYYSQDGLLEEMADASSIFLTNALKLLGDLWAHIAQNHSVFCEHPRVVPH